MLQQLSMVDISKQPKCHKTLQKSANIQTFLTLQGKVRCISDESVGRDLSGIFMIWCWTTYKSVKLSLILSILEENPRKSPSCTSTIYPTLAPMLIHVLIRIFLPQIPDADQSMFSKFANRYVDNAKGKFLTLKDYEEKVKKLEQENLNLKIRIHFMEGNQGN